MRTALTWCTLLPAPLPLSPAIVHQPHFIAACFLENKFYLRYRSSSRRPLMLTSRLAVAAVIFSLLAGIAGIAGSGWHRH